MDSMKRRLAICSLLCLCLAGTSLSACKKNSKSTASTDGDKQANSAAEKIDKAKDKAIGNGDENTGKYPEALEKQPCKIVTPEMVAKTFKVPADKLEKHQIMNHCDYSLEQDGKKLNVELTSISVFDNTDAAQKYFKNATRDMSAKEVSDAMKKIHAQANKDGKLDTAKKKQAANTVTKAMGGHGTSFETIDGLGANARLDKNRSNLVLQKDNLYFHLAAYFGPEMPMPKTISVATMEKASADWHKKTAPQRKKAVVALASPVIKHLDSLAK